MEAFLMGIGIITCVCLMAGLGFCIVGLIDHLDSLDFADDRLRNRVNRLEEEEKTEETELLHERIDKLEVRQSEMLKRHGEDMKRVLTKNNELEVRQRKLIDLDIWYDRLAKQVDNLEKGK